MSTSILTEATNFLTDCERAHAVGEPPSALIVNPEATADSLFAAVESRACRLRDSLLQWTLLRESDTPAPELASNLEPLAQEVQLLLEHLRAAVHKEKSAGYGGAK